ncbi:tetratricopeptide repeat protein [Marinimicrobium sp. ABcell2]|uniref:tetratricopeptide repeat protein n=1 Tax=Marinimicrobium sp. ABcell2 TaxID=3069751 RepID=UPI0027B192FB|nr:tetratricopeptide repeat protein [Marinimicrobium sp. ABcell2]MDQ2076648.1 tetratricopeptide repeat protein [Marinimicrobium sp. ABcell2]
MAFTDHKAFGFGLRLALAVVLCVGLTACAIAPDAPSEHSDVDDREPSALPAGPVTPNPYTQQRIPVTSEARALFKQASAAMEAQQWRQAEQLLLEMTEAFPQLSGAQVNLGLVYLALNEPQRAEQALRRALDINPQNLDAYNQLALLKRQQGDFDSAEHLYQQALAVWPFHAQTHRNLGILYDLYQGEWERALLHYRAYQQLQEQPEMEMTGWIIDLERRIDSRQTAQTK